MEPTDYIRFLMALLFVLALMGGLYLILKRLSAGGVAGLAAGGERRFKNLEIFYCCIHSHRNKVFLISGCWDGLYGGWRTKYSLFYNLHVGGVLA